MYAREWRWGWGWNYMRKFLCDDGIVLYLYSSGDYVNLCMGWNCIQLHIHAHTPTQTNNCMQKWVKTEWGVV